MYVYLRESRSQPHHQQPRPVKISATSEHPSKPSPPPARCRGRLEIVHDLERPLEYNSHDKTGRACTTIIHNLVDCASKGGNYLLNVGPGRSARPGRIGKRLAKVGTWMKQNGSRSRTRPARSGRWPGADAPEGCRPYLHVFDRPADGVLVVPITDGLWPPPASEPGHAPALLWGDRRRAHHAGVNAAER